MEIAKTSYLYRWAYYFMRPSFRPSRTNLCSFFWRFVLIGVIGMGLFWLVWVPIATLIGLLFASRPRIPHIDGRPLDDDLFTFYGRWPKVNGVRIVPIFILLLVAVLYLAIFTFPGRVSAGAVLAVLVGWIGYEAVSAWLKSRQANAAAKTAEPGFISLTAKFFKAQKRRICPIIWFR